MEIFNRHIVRRISRRARLIQGTAGFRVVFTVCLLLMTVPTISAIAQEDYSFKIARIKYAGGGDWYGDPLSLVKLLEFARAETNVDVAPKDDVVELTSDDLYSYPYLYLTGHGNVHFSNDEAIRLHDYLIGGGFLHIDDNYGLDRHIRREMKKVFPDRGFVELPFSHGIYHTRFEFPDGLPKIHEHDGKPAQGFGILDEDGRLLVFYSYESDLGDGWEPEEVHHDPPEKRLAALRMGTNILTWALMN